MASLALGVVGGVVGSFFGPLGTSIGFMVGSMVGTALFPETVHGPKLTDLRLQGSSYGAPIGVEWGCFRCAGNVVWKTDLQANEHTSGGKGGPEVVTTTYSASFDIVICESHGDHTLGRVWVNGQLKGDYRADSSSVGDLPLVFYNGSADQLPDPTEEGILGAGLVPAYRGVARVVLTDMDLSPYGNTIPQFNFEICQGQVDNCPVASTFDAQTSDTWHTIGVGDYPYIVSWDANDREAEPVVTPIPVTYAQDGGGVVYIQDNGLPAIRYWSYFYYPGPLHIVNDIPQRVWVALNGVVDPDDLVVGAGTISTDVDHGAADHDLATGNVDGGLYVHGCVGSYDAVSLFIFTGELPHDGTPRVTKWWKLIDGDLVSTGTVDPPLTYYAIGIGNFVAPAYEAYGSSQFENNGRFMWHHWAGGGLSPGVSNYMRCYQIDDAGNFAQICADVNVPHWAGGYTGTVATQASGSVAAFANGYCGVVAYQTYAIFERFDHAGQGHVLLSQIVSDICQRVGLTSGQIDVTDIEIPVRGYMLTDTPITARAALESILPVFSVDAVESDGVVKFVKREGKVSIATLSDDDLSAHADGQELPPKLQVVRAQDAELPLHMILKYIQADADYLLGAQQTRRQTGGTKVQVTANVPVVLNDAEAKKIVDVWLFNAWIERERYTWYTTRKHAKYEPTDIVNVGDLDLRITAKLEGADGVIKWEGRKAYAQLYDQAGDASDGAPGAPSDGIIPGEVVPAQATDLVLLDIPYIADPARQAVYWAAMAGHDRPEWRGASLQKSIDGGSSYSEIATSTSRSAIGTASTTLGDFDGGNVFDHLNRMTVVMAAGAPELSGVTRTAVLNGANRAMIGDELIQYQNATLTAPLTYELGCLLRGRNGTEWAIGTHVADETFVALPVATELASVYAEYNTIRQYKAVTFGRTLATATAQDFTNTGVSLKCFAPVLLGGGRNTAGDILLHWTRRARINNAWIDGIDVPVGETFEGYKVLVYADGTYASLEGSFEQDVETCTIDAATQTAIFGSPQAVLYWGVRQYGALGYGYEARSVT